MGYIRLGVILAVFTYVTMGWLYLDSILEKNKQLEIKVSTQQVSIATLLETSSRQKKAIALNTELAKTIAELQKGTQDLEYKLSRKDKYIKADRKVLTRAINIGTIRVLRELSEASSGKRRGPVPKSTNSTTNNS